MQQAPDSAPAMGALVVGFFLSPVIAAVVQCHWGPRAKAMAAFAVYLVAAAGTVACNGCFDLAHWPTTLLAVVATAIGGYTGHRSLWNPTGVSPAIEQATSGRPGAGE